MKVLICAEDHVVINIIEFTCQQEALGEVITATDLRKALGLIKLNNIKLIIIDIQLPVQSVLDIISFVRKSQCFKTPILLLSTDGLEEIVIEAFQLGANDYLQKPFTIPELIVRIKNLLK
ncbi:MAG: response regulator [Cytophagia bacterium]|nr:response regulator [Cytophagia bacterium]